MTEPQRQALDALYLAEGWTDASGNHLEPVESDWVVSAYRDAHVFSPGGGRRANLLWLVRAEQRDPGAGLRAGRRRGLTGALSARGCRAPLAGSRSQSPTECTNETTAQHVVMDVTSLLSPHAATLQSWSCAVPEYLELPRALDEWLPTETGAKLHVLSPDAYVPYGYDPASRQRLRPAALCSTPGRVVRLDDEGLRLPEGLRGRLTSGGFWQAAVSSFDVIEHDTDTATYGELYEVLWLLCDIRRGWLICPAEHLARRLAAKGLNTEPRFYFALLAGYQGIDGLCGPCCARLPARDMDSLA